MSRLTFLRRRPLLWAGVAVAALAGALLVGLQLVDEPLRRSIERRMNESLVGYTARVGSVKLHVFGLWTDARNVTVRQERHPDPPVLVVPRLTASVQWRALFRGKIVADSRIEHPFVHLDLAQLREEATDAVPMDERGWQDALQAIYPLRINELVVEDGTLSYQDAGDARPLEVSRIFILAEDIRNRRSKEGTYPSTVRGHGVVFDHGSIAVEARADFLLKPFPGVQGNITVDRIDLGYFQPVAHHLSLRVKGGELAASGRFAYAPDLRRLDLDQLTIDRAVVDYVTTPETAEHEALVKKAVARAARAAALDPTIDLVARRIRMNDCRIGYVNANRKPTYDLFLTAAQVDAANFSNRPEHGVATAELRGRFMGSGATHASARFLPEGTGPNFDASLQIEKTQLRDLNDLLRAYGRFDVAGGTMSFYSEVRVRDGWVQGYVKPLFKDVNVYSRRQDKRKNLFRQAYEAIVGGLAELLENRERKEVATVTRLSGPVGHTQTNTGEVIAGLLENAFVKAILPGFLHELEKKKPPKERAKIAKETR